MPVQLRRGKLWPLRKLAAGTRRLRLVGEVDFGADRDSWAEWARFEAIINTALAHYPLWNVCMYNAQQLPSEVLAAAELTHPYLLTTTARIPNPRYLDPARLLRQLPTTGPDPVEATPGWASPAHRVGSPAGDGERVRVRGQ